MDKQAKTIFFLITSLNAGGAERQVSYLLKTLPNSYVICLDHVCEYDDVPQNQIIYLSQSINHNFKKLLYFPFYIWKIRALILPIYKNAVIISLNSLPHILHFLLLLFVPVKSIFSVRSTLSQRYKGVLNKIYLKVLVFTYKKAQQVTVNSEGSKHDLITMGVPNDKIMTIPNMYNVQYIRALALEEEDTKWNEVFKAQTIVQVGRFDYAKGHKYFLPIFAKLLRIKPNVKLVLVGKGELKNEIIANALHLGLRVFDWGKDTLNQEYDVYMVGHHQNPYWFTKKATIFALTSLFEGLPNVLIEALITGTVCIATDCKSGPREILAPESNSHFVASTPEFTPFGVLMPPFQPDVLDQSVIEDLENQWVDTLSDLLDDKNYLARLKASAMQRGEDYTIEKITTQWNNIIYP